MCVRFDRHLYTQDEIVNWEDSLSRCLQCAGASLNIDFILYTYAKFKQTGELYDKFYGFFIWGNQSFSRHKVNKIYDSTTSLDVISVT